MPLLLTIILVKTRREALLNIILYKDFPPNWSEHQIFKILVFIHLYQSLTILPKFLQHCSESCVFLREKAQK